MVGIELHELVSSADLEDSFFSIPALSVSETGHSIVIPISDTPNAKTMHPNFADSPCPVLSIEDQEDYPHTSDASLPSNKYSDVLRYLGRVYVDPEDGKDYRVNDIWFDDDLQEFVAARTPVCPPLPTDSEIARGSLDHEEQGEKILFDSVVRICADQEERFHPLTGQQMLVNDTFRCEVLDAIDHWIEKGVLAAHDVFALTDERGESNLYRRYINSNTGEEIYQLIISDGPSGLHVRSHLLYAAHEYCGHLRYSKMYSELQQRAWWPGMQVECKAHAQSCGPCQARGTANDRRTKSIPILRNPTVFAPFQVVSVDILEINPDKHGMRYVIVAVDHFTKWAEAAAQAATPTAIDVNEFMMSRFYFRHGALGTILADNGKNITVNELNATLFALLGATIRNTTAYHPQANGQVERFNKPILDFLATFCNDQKQDDWSEFLEVVMHTLNTSVCSTTGYTPFFLVHGREANRVIDFRLPSFPRFKKKTYQEYAEHLQEVLLQAHLIAKANTDAKHSLYNQPRVAYATISSFRPPEDDSAPRIPPTKSFRRFKPKDWVLVFTPVLLGSSKTLRSRKLQKYWRGPSQIEKVINDTTYVVNVGTRSQPIHVSRLKMFNRRIHTVTVPF